MAIAGLKDEYTQYVFENRQEAIRWIDSFGEKGAELSKQIRVSGMLADFAEANNIEEKFEKTGEIPKEFAEFESKVLLEEYGIDLQGNNTGRTEGAGFIYDDCYWTGRTGLVYGPRAILWALDKKVSSYSVAFVSWIGFHDKRFYRGKSLYLWIPNFERTFCDFYTGWNNRARSLTTFIAI